MKYFGACRLDTLNECLWREDAQLPLPPRPYAVLQYLVEHPDRLITHNEFMEALWPGTYVQPQVLRTYVLELRKLLRDDASNPLFIATVPKRGYRFLAPVTDAPVLASRTSAAARSGRAASNAATNAASDETSPEIVGRDLQLAKLAELMQRACAGERQVVFITGEPGIGKTALVDAFCVGDCSGARVARGQSMEHFGNREPFYPVKELLRDLTDALCGPGKGDKTLRLLGRITSWDGHPNLEDQPPARVKSAPVGPAPAPASPAAASSVPAQQTPGDLCDTLEAIAQETALLLVFEDLQWADTGTLDLFSALARRRGHARLMLIATCRPSSSHAAAQPLEDDRKSGGAPGEDRRAPMSSPPTLRALKQDLAKRRLCTMIELAPLDKSAVKLYVTRELLKRHMTPTKAVANDVTPASHANSGKTRGEPGVPAGLVEFLHEQSNGNPLYLSAILDHLICQGVLDARATSWTLRGPLDLRDIGVPGYLREMIELEIDSLSTGDQRLLEAASIAGVVFPVWAAKASITPGSMGDQTEAEEEVEEQFETLSRRAHFIRAAGHDELPDGARSTSYVFAHPYYREVLYRRQPEVRRSRGHQRIADQLAMIFAGSADSVAAEVAGHYEAAGNWKSAAQTLAALADSQHRREDASALLERALQLLANLGERERGALEVAVRDRMTALSAAAKTTATKSPIKKATAPAMKSAVNGKSQVNTKSPVKKKLHPTLTAR